MVGAPHEHEIILAGAHGGSGPAIIERMDDDFIAAMLAELETKGVAAVTAGIPPGERTLFQPVHRVFNVVLVEAHCEVFGTPRLDPAKIESAGIVVRRLIEDEKPEEKDAKKSQRTVLDDTRKSHLEKPQYEAWLADSHRALGWTRLNTLAEADADPDPARREAPRLTTDRNINRTLAGDRMKISEHAASLFVAPPAVQTATGRTLLFNVLPVASMSRAGSPKSEEPDRKTWADHLPNLLWERNETKITFAAPLDKKTLQIDATAGALLFLLLVRQLAQEFNLLRPSDKKLNDAFLASLNQLTVTLSDDSKRKAGEYVLESAQVMFGEKGEAKLLAPKTWPGVNDRVAADLVEKLRAISDDIRDNVVAKPGSAGRFDEVGRRYVVRAFIRVKCENGCPPKLIWGHYSEAFKIAQWFASSPVPPIQIRLPDPADPDFKKNALPGVAFTVPESVAKFLNQDMKKFFKGEGGEGRSLGLGFICGFSIPIITLCAFIVLNIMLSLLNIIFWWLPYVKICLPFPKPK